jgi:UPF0755 protein
MKRVAFGAAVALILLGLLAWFGSQAYMLTPIGALASPVELVVEEGASLNAVAAELGRRNVLESPRLFALAGRLSGKAQRVQAGEYVLEPGISPAGILDLLVAGRVKLYPFTILEGWTFNEVLAAMEAHPAIVTTVDSATFDAAAVLGDTLSGSSNPEGWFFPETYFVPRKTLDTTVLRQASKLMADKLGVAWDGRAPDLPLANPYELLILASIIEREAALDSERATIAGVFIRRLRKGMRLQTDPTVIYGLGPAFDGNLTRANLLADGPYNTYTRDGLPPTPIGMPGAASLHAAGHPDDGNALFFVASGDGDGSHVFSATLEEHNAAVAAYIAQLRRASRANRESRAAGSEQ